MFFRSPSGSGQRQVISGYGQKSEWSCIDQRPHLYLDDSGPSQSAVRHVLGGSVKHGCSLFCAFTFVI